MNGDDYFLLADCGSGKGFRSVRFCRCVQWHTFSTSKSESGTSVGRCPRCRFTDVPDSDFEVLTLVMSSNEACAWKGY
ncbi:MAG: hypothetical protein K2H92_00235 [Bacteroidaceae bacterium]|nr:hypothetical protein [Bacteroidaceae bacterium]